MKQKESIQKLIYLSSLFSLLLLLVFPLTGKGDQAQYFYDCPNDQFMSPVI